MPPISRTFTSACEYRLQIHLGDARGAGFATPWRRLHQLLLEWSDDGQWKLRGSDNVMVAVQPGCVLTVMPGALHCLAAPRALHSNWVMFDALAAEGQSLLTALHLPQQLPSEISERVKQILITLGRQRPPEGLEDRARLNRHAAELLELLAGASKAVPGVDPWGDPRVAAVLHHVHANLGGELDRVSLARVANLSPTRLHYVFSAVTGLAPMEYVRQERIRQAQHLLLTTHLSAHRIAGQCGFRTPQYFATCFRTGTGYTPVAFRRQFADTAPRR